MEPDKFQQAWQSHASQTRVTIDADLLLKQVQRNQRELRAAILRRDFIEVGLGLLLIPFWFYMGMTTSVSWTWYLTVPVIVWIVGFFLVDRMAHPQTPGDPAEPLLSCVKNSLDQVEHQIWLLRNVFWWYLLPLTVSILAFFAHMIWQSAEHWSEVFVVGGVLFGTLLALYSFIDYINQYTVRSNLEPRRRELLALLANLGEDDSPEEDSTMCNPTDVYAFSILRRWLMVTLLCFTSFIGMTWASRFLDHAFDHPPQVNGPKGEELGRVITDLRKGKKLVGLAAMVTIDGKVEAAAAVGERKYGSGVPLEITDRFHLGGITKSVNATMIARLVESGRMQWSDTLAGTFPDASIHEDWKPVTLIQLLTDTAGAPAGFSRWVSRHHPPLGPECTKARLDAVLDVIAEPPSSPPGRLYAYSNVGCTIAAAMAEKVTGTPWEELVKREVFDPLELTEAGFGPPESPDDSIEQPRGHRNRLAGKIAVDDQTDNSSIMGPSGMVHMSLKDLCTYATEHLHGDLGTGKLLSAETYKVLHTPGLKRYACGWIVKEPTNSAPWKLYWHNGSNTLWYSMVLFIPDKKMVIAVTSNDGDLRQAEIAAFEIERACMQDFKSERIARPSEP